MLLDLPNLLCLTSDDLEISHSQQVLEFSEVALSLSIQVKKLSDQDFLKKPKDQSRSVSNMV